MSEIVFIGIVPPDVREQGWSEARGMIKNRPRIPGAVGTVTSRWTGDLEGKAFGAMGEEMVARLFGMKRTRLDGPRKLLPDLDDWLEVKTTPVQSRAGFDKAHCAGELHVAVDDYCMSEDHYAMIKVLIYKESHGVWLVGWMDAPAMRKYPFSTMAGHRRRREIPMLELRDLRSLPVIWNTA